MVRGRAGAGEQRLGRNPRGRATRGGGWEEPYPPHGPVTPTGYASQTLQEGRDMVKTRHRRGVKGSGGLGLDIPLFSPPTPSPPCRPWELFPPGSHSWLGRALPVPPGTFLGA